MLVLDGIASLRAWRRDQDRELSIGLVPTMGALHEGHLSLIRRARQECDRVAVSIFVNPAQFGPNEDLETYPRDRDGDISLAAEAGADLTWFTRSDQIYPEGFATKVELPDLAERLCGLSRPVHFPGVALVVRGDTPAKLVTYARMAIVVPGTAPHSSAWLSPAAA